MVAIMAECDAIEKGRKNQQQGFSFRGIDDVYNALHPLFAKHRVYVRTEVVDRETHERTTKSGGTAFHHFVRVRFHLTHEDGSSIVFETIGEAADTGDKGVGKTLSYALKSALFAGLLIPTAADNDPDATSHEFAAKPSSTAPAPQPPVPEKTPDPPHVRDLAKWMKDALGVVAYEDAKVIIWGGTKGKIGDGMSLRTDPASDILCRQIQAAYQPAIDSGTAPAEIVRSAHVAYKAGVPF